MYGRDALFSGHHKPIPGGLTAAVQAADTHEKSIPSILDFDMLSIGGNQINL